MSTTVDVPPVCPIKIDIVTAVDVQKALSNRQLYGSYYMMDNSPFYGFGQGTADIITACRPGDLLNWKVHQIDLQTPILLKEVRFFGVEPFRELDPGEHWNDHLEIEPSEEGTFFPSDHAYAKRWRGRVPLIYPGYLYRYALKFQMSAGVNSVMWTNRASLIYANPNSYKYPNQA